MTAYNSPLRDTSTTAAEKPHVHEWKDASETTLIKKEKCIECGVIRCNDLVYLPLSYYATSTTSDTK